MRRSRLFLGSAFALILQLAGRLLEEYVGYCLIRPDLAMRMGVTRAHHATAIFKDGHGVDVSVRAQAAIFRRPSIDDLSNQGERHSTETDIV